MIFFNNAATSYPKPEGVFEAIKKCLTTPPVNAARAGFDVEAEDCVQACRSSLAKLFNFPDPQRIVFSSGSTESLNLAINGLDLSGGHVVTTMIEHNSVIRPLKHKERDEGLELTFVECDARGWVDPENIKSAIKDNTKLIVVNHCSNVTGAILDVKRIAEIAHEAGIPILVDGSQSSGAVPIDLTDWDIDMFAFTGHKSLFGPQGTGGLCIKENMKLKPFKVGGTGVLSEVLTQPEGMPLYYEAGTPNTPGIAGLSAGVKFVLENGVEKIAEHKRQMVGKMLAEFENADGINIITSRENNAMTNFCFTIENMPPEEVGYFLESSYEIIVRTGLHCAPKLLEPLGVYPWGTVRASPSFFSTDKEVDTFIEGVKDILETFVKRK